MNTTELKPIKHHRCTMGGLFEAHDIRTDEHYKKAKWVCNACGAEVVENYSMSDKELGEAVNSLGV